MKDVNSKPVQLAVLSVSLLLTSYGVISGIIPQIRDALGVSEAAAELLVTTPSLVALITLFISPALARIFGLKQVIAAGVLLIGVTAIVPIFATSYTAIMAARIVFGLGLGLYNSLAITLIQVLYKGNTRSQMLGIRGATENIGQAVFMALVSGLFALAGWHGAFGVYLLAFPILVWFWISVPNISLRDNEKDEADDSPTGEHYAKKSSPVLILFCLFAVFYLIVLQSNNVRWAQLAQNVMGKDFDSSMILSVGTVLGILSGLLFGTIVKKFGAAGTFYIGVGIYFVASLLLGFANGNFVVLVIGNFLFNIPGAILGPLLCDNLPRFAPKHAQAFWSTAIIISFHVGVFLSPLVMSGLEMLLGTTNPAAAFPIYAVLLGAIMVGFYCYTRTHKEVERQ